MANDIIYGKFQHNGKEYPFFLADHIITITQTPREFNTDFSGISHFDYFVQ